MRRHKWLRRIVILALLFLLGMMLLSPDRKEAKKTAEDVSAGDSDARTDAAEEENAGGGSETAAQMDQTVVGWVIDKVAAGEIELSDENSVRQALEEAEREFEISLAAEDEERIVGFLLEFSCSTSSLLHSKSESICSSVELDLRTSARL